MRTTSALYLFGAMNLTACAAMIDGTVESSREILLTSQPTLAQVTQGTRRVCQTPCTVRQGQLRYGEAFTFTFPSGGSMTVDPQMEVSGRIVGNVIFGGGVGALIDVATGRLVINSRHVHAELDSIPAEED